MVGARDCLGCLAPYIPHKSFTRVQECAIPTLMNHDINVVVSAPTGSGKTALLEVAMLRLFRERLSGTSAAGYELEEVVDAAQGGHSSEGSADEREPGRKAVYICPIKALASEKYTTWRERFPTLSVALEVGDQESVRTVGSGMLEVSNADIIITTPERWDGITRRWKEGVIWSLVASVGLLLLDEVHTVSEDRGAVLEAIVSRMKTIKLAMSGRCPRAYCTRFVAISGTLPNIEDFAEWLQVPPQGVHTFTSADRPVPLSLRVVSYPSSSTNPFAFDRFLSFKLFGLIRKFSDGRPTIVFCASRSEAINSALRIVESIKEMAAREGALDQLRASGNATEQAATAIDKQLRSMLLLGVAYHHAAMAAGDRTLVEQMFKDHFISVVCTTTTLALGVNVPAHLVIIKGTTFFKNGRREDLPLSEVAQMSGRAGRPGLDTHGVALVLTTEDKAVLYEPLRHGDSCTVVESRLHQKMIEHVNAEVALRTIHSFSLGVEWIKTTFLWIRLQRCPRHYGILFPTREKEKEFDREDFAAQLMRSMLTRLEKQGCVTIRCDCSDVATDDVVRAEQLTTNDQQKPGDGCPPLDVNTFVESTRVGRAMARRYILFKTVEMLNAETSRLRADECGEMGLSGERTSRETAGKSRIFTLSRILRVLCNAYEFEDLRLRQGDKKHLNELNKRIRFPLSSGMRGGREVREDWHKVYVLIQAQLGHVAVTDFSLRNDCVRLWTSAPRLAHFIVDYAATLDSFSFVKESALLHRCMEQRMWWDGPILKQIEGVCDNVAKSLHQRGIKSILDVMKTDPRKLEALADKNPPFGSELREKCSAFPQCNLLLEHRGSSCIVRVSVPQTRRPSNTTDTLATTRLTLLVGDVGRDRVHMLRRINLEACYGKPVVFTFVLPHNFDGKIMGCIFTERHLLGSDVCTTLVVDGAKNSGSLKSPSKAKVGELAVVGHEVFPSCAACETPAPCGGKRHPAASRPLATTKRELPAPVCAHAPLFQPAAVQHQECIGDFVTECANAMLDGKSPPAAVDGAATADCKQPMGVGGKMAVDEDYEQLMERKASIAAAWHFNRNKLTPPASPRKRSRERAGAEPRWPCEPSPRASLETERFDFPRLRREGDGGERGVLLPKALSPVPAPSTHFDIRSAPPSQRFRFVVRGACPRRVTSDMDAPQPQRQCVPCYSQRVPMHGHENFGHEGQLYALPALIQPRWRPTQHLQSASCSPMPSQRVANVQAQLNHASFVVCDGHPVATWAMPPTRAIGPDATPGFHTAAPRTTGFFTLTGSSRLRVPPPPPRTTSVCRGWW
ncbi:DEAD DEAH box helicase Helicase conserved C terminal domain [Trypanosoma vivax]|nr:DEAD DEAH box helicase Helicase conserved C terminal domain [Trypanosoma vivax]